MRGSYAYHRGNLRIPFFQQLKQFKYGSRNDARTWIKVSICAKAVGHVNASYHRIGFARPSLSICEHTNIEAIKNRGNQVLGVFKNISLCISVGATKHLNQFSQQRTKLLICRHYLIEVKDAFTVVPSSHNGRQFAVLKKYKAAHSLPVLNTYPKRNF
jgi:hypothetical protein